MDLKPGTRVKNYTLERQLGRGASGEVWKAYDETKTVAIKFMNENLMTSASAAKHRERLIREVEALRRLQHPNIPTLYDYDLDFVRPYIAMRFVGGDSYDRLISNGEMLKIPLERRLEMIRDIAFALTAAHEAGIIHRDIKPANLTGIENPYLLDFSISLETDEVEHTQRFVGTTLYMSSDGVADRLSDNYSFAVVVYEMLFGKHPIYQLGDSIFNQFIAEMRIRNRQWSFPTLIPPGQRPADLRGADLRKLDAIFERAIGTREQRYVDLREFVRDLRAAIFPHEAAVEVPQPVAPAARQLSQAPLPSARHVSQPPQPSPPVQPTKAEVAQEAEVSPEESNFLDKAFLNLPAVKPPEPAAPPAELEQTNIQHSTVPWDYENKQRKPVQKAELAGPEDGTRMEMPAVHPKSEAPASQFAGPDDMTMMEIRIPPAAEPEPPSPVAEEPEAVVQVDVPAVAPDVPSAEAKPSEPAERVINQNVVLTPQSPPPAPAVDYDRTVPDLPAARPPQPPAQAESYTVMEMQSPYASSYPGAHGGQQPEENFTLLEAQGGHQQTGSEQFTVMEMQTPHPQQVQGRRQGDDFTLLEVNTADQVRRPVQQHGSRRTLVIVAVVIVVLLVVAAIVFVALNGAAVP